MARRLPVTSSDALQNSPLVSSKMPGAASCFVQVTVCDEPSPGFKTMTHAGGKEERCCLLGPRERRLSIATVESRHQVGSTIHWLGVRP